MFISARIHETLLEAGLQIIDLGDGSVDFHAYGPGSTGSMKIQVKSSRRSIGPSQLEQLAQTNPNTRFLLIAPTFSEPAKQVISRHGWSWIADSANGPISAELRLHGNKPIEIGTPVFGKNASRGRKPWQRSAIVRHLLLGSTWSQAALVEACKVTQPRVSQVLKELQADALVARSGTSTAGFRWVVSDYSRLFDQWVTTYPGPGGSAPTYWYGLEDIVDQTQAAMSHLQRTPRLEGKPGPKPVASGDAAADFFAPTRRSQISVIYSPWGADLSSAGLTPSPEETATLKLVVPTDASVWPLPSDDRSAQLAPSAPYPLADPLQVAWDLLDTGRADSDQAIVAIKRALQDARAADRWT